MNMDWFEQLEQRRKAIILLLVLIAVAVLGVSALRDPFALDSYWHLKMGQDWIEKGLSPFRDHYSITHYGEEILAPPYPFQLALYGVVELLGEQTGFKFFVFANSLIVLGLLLVWLRQIRAPVLVSFIAIFTLIILLQSRVMVRPELFSYLMLAISLILYERTRTKPSHKNFLLIAIFMLLWRNYHSSILGYVVFFGLFIDVAYQHIINKATPKNWMIWVAWGLTFLATGFLGQNFVHPVLETLLFPTEWIDVLDEFGPALKGEVMLSTLGVIPISLATLIGLFQKRLFGYFIVCAIMSWYAVTMHRMTTPGGLVVVFLFALILTQSNIRSLLTRGPLLRQRGFSAVLILLGALSLITSVLTARSLIEKNRSMLGYFPDQIVEHMKRNDKKGQIFNDYNIGGYLIYHLGDESRVFVDGRTGILYPYEHYVRYQSAMTNSDRLREEFENLDIDYVVVGNRRDFIDLVRDTGVMALDFSDLRYSLYSRQNAMLPVSGSLWSMPWCWSELAGEALIAESDNVRKKLPHYSPVTHFVNMATDFYHAEDRAAYLEAIGGQDNFAWYEDNLRFAGYRAMDLGKYEYAVDKFYRIRQKFFKDYLAGSLANLRAGRVDEAESILYKASQINWRISDPNEVKILFRILSEIQVSRPFKSIETEYYKLASELVEIESNEAEKRVEVSMFCN